MEGDCMDIGSSGATLAGSRWNPTKEQISMLESLYRQGIRTPSAEQIQQITSRLRAYGHIEGKNVFYWFQNHKARQRQKQKQERMAFFNRYLHKAQPVFPPCTNVLCGPYYLPRSNIGFYPQCSKVVLPGGSKRRAKVEDQMENPEKHHDYNILMEMNNINDSGIIDNNQETLTLFPLHPTGILQGRAHSTCVDSSITPSSSETNTGIEDGSCEQTFFDFFSVRGCESN